MLKIMAMGVLRKIAGDIQVTEFFKIVMDECADVANKEQVSTPLLNTIMQHRNSY